VAGVHLSLHGPDAGCLGLLGYFISKIAYAAPSLWHQVRCRTPLTPQVRFLGSDKRG
jgi:hypothetical protein